MRQRAIQIGLARELSALYVESVICIEEVTDLAHAIGDAHSSHRVNDAMQQLAHRLPEEKTYEVSCTPEVLSRLGLEPGPVAD